MEEGERVFHWVEDSHGVFNGWWCRNLHRYVPVVCSHSGLIFAQRSARSIIVLSLFTSQSNTIATACRFARVTKTGVAPSCSEFREGQPRSLSVSIQQEERTLGMRSRAAPSHAHSCQINSVCSSFTRDPRALRNKLKALLASRIPPTRAKMSPQTLCILGCGSFAPHSNARCLMRYRKSRDFNFEQLDRFLRH